MRLILDAMGTDDAPAPEVIGALEALAEDPGDLEITLVGDENLIRSHITKSHPGLRIIHAPERVDSHEKATQALRYRRNSSLAVGLKLLGEGAGDAFASAGNTGAVMAFAMKELRTIPGVNRPGIAAFFPKLGGGYNLIIDVGANVDAKPRHLEQFAIMGCATYRHLFQQDDPRVGILSVGEEAVKGNALVHKTKELLERGNLNFVGYVEGHELLLPKADVIVMDGFVGNVVLKFGEGVVYALFKFLKQEVKSRPEAIAGALLMRRAIGGLRGKVDFEEYGGAPLLGVNGLVLICHGRSSPRAMKNAIKTLGLLHRENLLHEIQEGIARSPQHDTDVSEPENS